MSKRIKYILIIAVFAVIIGGGIFAWERGLLSKYFISSSPVAGNSPTPTSAADETAGWNTYTDSNLGFEIKYPKDLEKSDEALGVAVLFNLPKEAEDKFIGSVNVVVQDLSEKPMTLEQYTELSLNIIKNKGGKIIESGNTTLAGSPAYKVVQTNKCTTSQCNGLNLEWMHIWTIKNNKAYLITYAAEEQKYQDFLKTFDEMVKSFKIF
jgi:serine/threonine-protein kinase